MDSLKFIETMSVADFKTKMGDRILIRGNVSLCMAVK